MRFRYVIQSSCSLVASSCSIREGLACTRSRQSLRRLDICKVEQWFGYCSDTRTKLVVTELNATPRILQLRGETPRDSKVSGGAHSDRVRGPGQRNSAQVMLLLKKRLPPTIDRPCSLGSASSAVPIVGSRLRLFPTSYPRVTDSRTNINARMRPASIK